MSHEVFISYSHKDKAVADAICNHLENEGLRCWYAPRDIKPGEEWGNSIVNGIEASRIMVLVFTPDSDLSKQVLREVNNAVSAGATIIPFRLTEEEPTGGMRYYLSSVHWLDAMNTELEDSINKLTELCKAIIEGRDSEELSNNGFIRDRDAQNATKNHPDPKKYKTLIAVAAVILLIVAGTVGIMLGKGSGGEQTESESSSAGEETVNESETSESSYDEELDIGAISKGVVDELGYSYAQGNSESNILNGGHLAFDGEWYYYTSNDENKLYRMKADGSDKQKLTDIPAEGINVYNGYVYFTSQGNGFMKMKTDGSEQTVISEYELNNPRIVNDRIYYGLVAFQSMKLDGSDDRTEWEVDIFGGISDMCFDGRYLYYYDTDRGDHLYRVDIKKQKEVCIYNDESVFQLRLAGRYLYFQTNKNFMSYDLKTGEAEPLTSMVCNYPAITKDGIYGYNFGVVFYSFKDETDIEYGDSAWNINVAGEKIFYEDPNTSTYYVMDLDGTNVTKL